MSIIHSLLLIVQLISIQSIERVQNTRPIIYQERIPTTNYNSPMGEISSLMYSTYPGVFDLQLLQLIHHNDSKIYFEEDDIIGGKFEENEAILSKTSGCHSIQRNIEVNQEFRVRLRLPMNQEIFYTDIVAVPHQNKAIIIRNDYKIFEIDTRSTVQSVFVVAEFDQSQSFENLLDTRDSPYSGTNQVSFLVEDTYFKRIYAITEDGGVSFQSQIPIKSPIFKFTKEEFLPRNTIYAVHYNQQMQVIFIASGFDGVDVYDVSSGKAVFSANINATLLGLTDEKLNIVDTDSNQDQTLLYILDFERGLLVVDISDKNNFKLIDFHIPISKARFFDHIDNTFMIVAETQNFLDYCVEVFVDFDKKQYYFNRFYVDEMAIFDVKIFEHFAVLIGYDAHKVVYHSIYQGFINHDKESHTYFQEPGLMKIMEMDFEFFDHSHKLTLVGLSKGEFKMFEIANHLPQVECNSYEPIINSTYLLRMNSTQCNKKAQLNDTSRYSQCQIQHAFFFSAYDSVSLADKVQKYALFIYILLFILMWLLIIGCFCYNRCGKTLNFLKWKTNKLQKQEQYDDFNEGPRNLTNQQQAQNIEMTQTEL